jgi:hypothetical protein
MMPEYLGKVSAAALCAAVLVSCARLEVAQFEPRQGQQAIIRDGVPVIFSRQRDSLALLRPARRQFQDGKRPVYVLALYNLTRAPLQFLIGNVHVAQTGQGGELRGLAKHI